MTDVNRKTETTQTEDEKVPAKKMTLDGQLMKTPFDGLVPKMSEQELAGLEASILDRGQEDAIEVDEQNNVLDGHHRREILIKHGMTVLCKVITSLKGDLEKRAYVIAKALNRRNLSSESTKELRNIQKKLYGKLRESDPRKWTLERIAELCGVDRSLVGRWYRNGTSPIAIQDGRRKVSNEAKKQIADELLKSSGNQVAKTHGLSKSTISRIRSEGKKQAEREQERADFEMQQLIEEGEEFLREARDKFYGFDDSVLVAALQDVFREWPGISICQQARSGDA